MAIPAPCLKKLLADANARWPNRNRASDGLLPSAEHHKQNPNSDHETGNAADLTHDPKSGPDCNEIVAQLTASNDPRIKYIIWNRRIWFPTAGKRPQGWSAYSGKNPHTKHAHISIKPGARNDLRPWPWSATESEPKTRRTLKRGDLGLEVQALQRALGIRADAIFGDETKAAVMKFQIAHGLKADGIVGAATNKALFDDTAKAWTEFREDE